MPTEKEIGGWVFPNNDHIIKMARSAGMHYSGACTLTGMESHLERFAALVAAHTLSNIDPSRFMSYQEGFAAGAAAEREACAKVCEEECSDPYEDFKNYEDTHTDGWMDGCNSCAAAIRARGETK